MPLTRAHRAHAATHHGVFALDDLRRHGATRRQIDHMVHTTELVRPLRGVYVLNGVPPSYDQRVAVVCAASRRVVPSHLTAGRLMGLRRLGRVDGIEVTVPGSAGVRIRDVTVHHTRLLRPGDVVERTDGVRHTSAARTVFDLSFTLPDESVESIIEQILDRHWHTLPELYATARDLCAPGRPGSDRFGRVVWSRPAWRRPAGSDLEVRLDVALRHRGMPTGQRGVGVRIGPHEIIHPDLWWPDLRLAVEIDHVTWHGGRLDAQYDKGRDRRAGRQGIQVVRVTDEEIDRRLHVVVDDILTIALQRRAA